MSEAEHQILVVTGLSGAGISTTLNILEDQGFEVMDNLPIYLLKTVLEARKRPVALSIDVRNRDFDPVVVEELLGDFRQFFGSLFSIMFIDCSDDELINRYSKTKRVHPMANDGRVIDGIAHERSLMHGVQRIAHYRLDTTGRSIWEFREHLLGLEFGRPAGRMRVRVISFSYGNGLPRDADVVIDVRFLRNPFYIPELCERDGRDERIAEYVMGDGRFVEFWQHLSDLLCLTLEAYEAEGKSYFTLAFGCTGGKHRSVVLAEKVVEHLLNQAYSSQVFHRELARHD